MAYVHLDISNQYMQKLNSTNGKNSVHIHPAVCDLITRSHSNISTSTCKVSPFCKYLAGERGVMKGNTMTQWIEEVWGDREK